MTAEKLLGFAHKIIQSIKNGNLVIVGADFEDGRQPKDKEESKKQ